MIIIKEGGKGKNVFEKKIKRKQKLRGDLQHAVPWKTKSIGNILILQKTESMPMSLSHQHTHLCPRSLYLLDLSTFMCGSILWKTKSASSAAITPDLWLLLGIMQGAVPEIRKRKLGISRELLKTGCSPSLTACPDSFDI